ncbi:hypothetical protein [Novipirellula sp.]|uniref:hypothetical protein n=1 Tax=Novipirellula sp. TaxID=2795430 RepID=UPI0035697D56
MTIVLYKWLINRLNERASDAFFSADHGLGKSALTIPLASPRNRDQESSAEQNGTTERQIQR